MRVRKLVSNHHRGWVNRWFLSGGIAIAAALGFAEGAIAQTTLPRIGSGISFQTSSPLRCASIGDWYTTLNPAGCPVNAAGQPGGTAPTGNPRFHTFFINLTAADIANNGGSVVISVLDAEINATLNPNAPDEVVGAPDPTRFRLFDPSGVEIPSTNFAGGIVPSGSPANTQLDFQAVTTPGVYTVRSEAGAGSIFGDNTVGLNDDDNSFLLSVPIAQLLIGQQQGTFQNNAVGDRTVNFFFLVGPGTSNLFLRNFDLDLPADGGVALAYTSPPGGLGLIAGTPSRQGNWNGPGPTAGNLDNGGDLVSGLNTVTDAGVWTATISNYGNIPNQSLLEANEGTVPGNPIPLFDTQPPQAGNFTITPPATPVQTTPVGTTVCQPFTITNNFFTSDIINLVLSGTSPNYTVELRDGSGTVTLTDTDGNGQVDTGILARGASIQLTLCVTPQPGAPPQDVTTVTGTSFLDARVRQQANNPVPPTTQQIPITTQIGAPVADLRLSKSVDNPAAGIGQNVTYTILLTNDGPSTATNVAVTDRLAPGLTFVAANPSQGTYDSSTGIWTVGTVPNQGTATLQLTATITAIPATNVAQVTASDQPDPDSTPGNGVAGEDDQATVTLGRPNLRILKRITAVRRGEIPTVFNTLVDDPNDANDNATGWAALSPVGVLSVPVSQPLFSGNEVEYTVYFLSDGGLPLADASICDLIPLGTTLISNTTQVKLGTRSLTSGGTTFSPLAPLPANNPCSDQTNPNGAVIFQLGTVPGVPTENIGFVRFRVRMN